MIEPKRTLPRLVLAPSDIVFGSCGCSRLGAGLRKWWPRVRQQVAEQGQADMGFRVPESTWRWVPEKSEQEALGTAFQELGGDRLQER